MDGRKKGLLSHCWDQDFIWRKHFLVRLSQRMSGFAGKAFAALPAGRGLNVFFSTRLCIFRGQIEVEAWKQRCSH